MISYNYKGYTYSLPYHHGSCVAK